MMDTHKWIERSRQGDREAFAKIVDRYQGMVSAVTLNVVGDYAQSEDLAQETFLTVWKKLPELRESEKLAAWIYGIARRTALHWTEKQRRNPLRGAAEIDGDTAVDPRVELEQNRQRHEQSLELVWSTVRELPEIFREPLLLYYRYSKSAAEIAESMNLSEDAVCQRLSRGRKMLKAEVEKQVESVLESTRPDTAFTLAVLTAIPLAATASGCAATTVSTVGSETLGKGAGFAGSGFVWILASIYLLIAVSVLGIFGTIIGYKQMLAVIRHSPGLRSRRLVLANSLWKTAVIALSLIAGIFLLLPVRSSWPGLETCGAALVMLILANLLLFWKWENRFVVMWRKAAAEDLMNEIDPSARRLSARNLYVPFFAALFIIVLVMAGLLGAVWHRGLAHGFDFAAFRIGILFLFLVFVVLAFVEYFRQGLKLASQEGLLSDPPPSLDVSALMPGKRDMLDYFLGIPGNPSAALKSGFYSETIMMGALILFSSLTPISVGLRQPNPWPVYVVIAAACLGFLIFTKYVAGKPPVRHLGWMATCLFFLTFFAVIDSVVLREALAKYPASKNQTMYLTMFLGGFGFCFYVSVATLAYFFHRKEPDAE